MIHTDIIEPLIASAEKMRVILPDWVVFGCAGWCIIYTVFLVKNLYADYQKRQRRKELAQCHFDLQDIRQKEEYYIETRAQNIPPALEDGAETGGTFIVTKELIPFFINRVFRKKEKEKFYFILGNSGMGKTTFMVNLFFRYTSMSSLNRAYTIKLLSFAYKDILEKIEEVK